ncbi:MAG: hypothetical protein O3B70_09320 [Bacteroidetes bacterium]|nr:hypothetical protein [Bacteroidota bacterium]
MFLVILSTTGFSRAWSQGGNCCDPSSDYYQVNGPCSEVITGDPGCDQGGCTEPTACNFEEEAAWNDGTCEYFSCALVGCTQAGACNYNAEAEFEDGSCEYESCSGCMNVEACNYNPQATISNDSCTFPPPFYTCAGTCVTDSDGDGICDPLEVMGCTDEDACNFDNAATEDDGMCDYGCFGCTDSEACNFDNAATEDNGTCEYLSCLLGGCMDPDACNFDMLADYDDGSCTYPGPFNCNCTGLVTDALGICGGSCVLDDNDNGICDSDEVMGCTLESAVNFNPLANVDDGTCLDISSVTTSLAFTPTQNSSIVLGQLTIDGLAADVPSILAAFDPNGSCVGWSLPVVNDGTAYVSLPLYGDDGTTPEVEGLVEGGSFQLGLILIDQDTLLNYIGPTGESLLGPWTNTNGAPMPGFDDPGFVWSFSTFTDCNDLDACNYQAGSNNMTDCIYPPEGLDCQGNCVQDSDEDGVCDPDEVWGCTEPSACNYEPTSTEDDGSCQEVDECGVCGGDGIPSGDCDCDGNQLDALGVCGGACASDADADGICDDVDDCVGAYDACGVCNGPGEIYECGCSDIPEGDCDCDGNQLDALGVCGGDCTADADADGICDDVDDCVGAYDACGLCNGPGEIYECGCSDIPEGDCDCDGNQLDALGVCGGTCSADEDNDGICDDVDDCVGALDACGVCNGPGEIYACGCSDIPAGDCDCDGNQLDAVGTCGGDCTEDADADGLCDDVDDCVGAYDACGVCNGPGEIYECGCANIPEGDCDCDGNQLDALGECGGACASDADADGICDDVDDCVGAYDAVGACNGSCEADLDGDGVCDDSEIFGCDDPASVNFDTEATENDGSCNYEGLDAPEGFSFSPGPSSGTILGVITLDGLAGSGLDWVGAFTPQGVCAGATNLTVYEGQSFASLTIYGDDPTTPDVVEGMEAGGTFSLRLFDASEGATVSYNGGQQFAGWLNTNGGALPGFSNPETVYAFFTPACPDTDGDGICNDVDDCPNQAADATGVCGGDCANDFNGNGVCDDVEVFGCTYPTADNFDPSATADDGSCVLTAAPDDGETIWATCEGDISGDGLVGVEDLLDLLLVYGTSCE